MDSGVSHRARRSRAAEVCRLCLKKRYLMDIDDNQYLQMQLKECFPHLLPEDSELPRFVCGECYQLVEITYQFSIRTRRTEVLLRSYVHMGGDFPNEKALEAEYRRNLKRSASPEKENQQEKPAPKKRRSSEDSSKSTDKTERKLSKNSNDSERKSSRHREEKQKDSTKHKERKEKDSSRQKDKSNRSSSSSKRKEKEGQSKKASMQPTKQMTETEQKRYLNSDEYLFGEAVDLEPVQKQNDAVEEKQPQKNATLPMESIASNLGGVTMSFEEIMRVLTTVQKIQNTQTVSM